MRIQWLNSVAQKVGLIGAALLTVSTLTSCGGGGATDTNVATGPLLVLPQDATLFPGTPVTFTISGGKAGYRVFSSDQVVIPLDPQVSGSGTFTVVANDVGADTPVVITARDSVNATATTTANVKVAVLNNQVKLEPFAPTDQPENLGCLPTNVCSGGEANVSVTAMKNNIKLINRPILFTVYQGNFQFVTPNSLSLVNSIIVNTDENGVAVAKLAAAAGAPTQVATLTIKDTTTGLLKYFNFNILQQTSGSGILSSLPSGDTTFTGPAGSSGGFSPGSNLGQCPVGFVDYYVFGGTPPYRIASPLPQLVLVAVNGQPFAAETILTTNGGSFVAAINGCGRTQLIITDATNRTIETSQIIGVKGADAPAPVVPAVAAPTVNPAAITLNTCGPVGAVTVVIGGTTPTVANIPTAGGGALISVVNGGTSATITRNNASPGPPPNPILVNFSNSAGTATLTVTLAGAAAAALGCP